MKYKKYIKFSIYFKKWKFNSMNMISIKKINEINAKFFSITKKTFFKKKKI
jgi:hypothetical protein